MRKHQKLPTNYLERERLREKGQFWTPDWVANAMVAYVIKGSKMLFDPAVGKGAFYTALIGMNSKKKVSFYGIDIDVQIINEVRKEICHRENNCKLEVRDFIFMPPVNKFKSIIANPPYVRHHRLTAQMKNKLKEISVANLGFAIDARAGLHVYFLIQALSLLDLNARLAFIMPADTCEGIFAKRLWQWVTQKFCLEAVITFSADATPFPGVDTNAVVFLIHNTKPTEKLFWIRALKPYSDDLYKFIKSDFKNSNLPTLEVKQRSLEEALETGLSRFPMMNNNFKYHLSDFARVMRGIATGANEFFHLTSTRVNELNIPQEFLKPAIARTRDVEGDCVTPRTLRQLQEKERPTFLFSPDGRKMEHFPMEVQAYLKRGESLGLPNRALIMTRKPWYKMEVREIPKFLFAYLGRRNARFIKNDAGVVPLTGFLCIYPRAMVPDYEDRLWKILNEPEVVENLKLVAKSYGSGAIKVEPRALESLPLPDDLIKKYNLQDLKSAVNEEQLVLF